MKPFSKEICDQTKDKELIVYGTGAVGEVVTQALLNWGRMPNLYCDHDPEKKVFFNQTVISPDRLKLHQNAVVILAFKDFLRSAVSFLRDAGIRECYSAESLILESFDDVCLSKGAQEFLIRKGHYHDLILLSEAEDPLVFQHLEWMLTERCTLRCRDCSALIPYFCNPRDHAFYKTANALNRVLTAADYISELSILGGEPLLYPYFADAITSYAGHEKIGAIVVYTNGTVLPNETQLAALQADNVWVHISDYGPCSKHLSKLEALFTERGIRFFSKRYDTWQSTGNLCLREEDESRLAWKYERCFKARCYSLFEDKLYGCARASNGAAAGQLPERDYVSFSENRTPLQDRAELMKLFSLPYLNACRYCGGMIEGNADIIPAIQQTD